MPSPPIIRPISPDDDLGRLTALIHAAYAAHAACGLRVWGTHQSVADTATRVASGYGLLAESDGEYVGTVTVRPPQPESPVAIYRDAHTWTISQFAVAPSFKWRGLGKALHEAALLHALRSGGRMMALDTAAPAAGLHSHVQRLGLSARRGAQLGATHQLCECADAPVAAPAGGSRHHRHSMNDPRLNSK